MDNRTLEEVRNNETKLIEEIKSLEKQLDYLRSGEYYNQLRFENEMLQQVVDTNGVPSEVYDYIDCTHRNTELLKENQELNQKYLNAVADYETTMSELQELKKQLEEWNYHLKCSKEMLDIQGHNGNYNYDSYMLGIYNGMEYIIALFETREPIFKSGKDIEFISDKTQQKEFIEYMNKTIEELECDDVDDEEMKGYLIQRIDTFKEILSKYKEIIGE